MSIVRARTPVQDMQLRCHRALLTGSVTESRWLPALSASTRDSIRTGRMNETCTNTIVWSEVATGLAIAAGTFALLAALFVGVVLLVDKWG